MSLIKTTDPIYFGGVDLNSISGWRTTDTDTYRYPKRDTTEFPIAYSNQQAITSAFYTERMLSISGVITSTGREALDDSISELRRILEPINQTLQLPVSGNQRIFNEVTVTNITISDVKGGYAAIDIELATTDPFNYSLTSVELLNIINLTSGNKSYPVTLEGRGDQAPIFTLTLDTVTNGTNKTITISNPATGKSISIEGVWAANDVLIINCKTKTVTVNAVDVDFDGSFPVWAKGLGTINYSDDFTQRQIDINVVYTKRYL